MGDNMLSNIGCGRARDSNKPNNQSGNGEYFCTRLSENILIYGLFADSNDNLAPKFACKHLPLEFLNLWKEQVDKPDIRAMLDEAFEIVENKMLQQFTSKQIDGTSAMVGVIYDSNLYLAYTGCSRALVCTMNENVLHVNQVNFEHNLTNVQEIKRLSNLGIDCSHFFLNDLCGYSYTRCLGSVDLKKFYRSSIDSSPWIAKPDIIGPVELDKSCIMIILMSSGLLSCLSKSGVSTDQINDKIAAMITHQIYFQATINDVAQVVVDEISSINDSTDTQSEKSAPLLIIHSFGNPFLHAVDSDSIQLPVSQMAPLTIDVGQNELDSMPHPKSFQLHFDDSPHISRQETMRSANDAFVKSPTKTGNLPLDEAGRIAPYVDFSFYYSVIEDKKMSFDSDFCVLQEFENVSKEIADL